MRRLNLSTTLVNRKAVLGAAAGSTGSTRLQRRPVVGWHVRQTFFQRRAGLTTVTACVRAGKGGYAAVVMAADDVSAFALQASRGGWAATLRP